jgi:small-conductance mechanosensitive channel
MIVLRSLSICLALFWVLPVVAQTESDTLNEMVIEAPLPETPLLTDGAPNFVYWETVATRVEDIILRNVASQFALVRLRADLVSWRDAFAGLLDQNEERLVTVRTQIVALGQAPAEIGEENRGLHVRRAELAEQEQMLAAPGLLIAEAYARADGLIRETDQLIRARQTSSLLRRGATPLNPAEWPTAGIALKDGVLGLFTEVLASLRSDLSGTARFQKLPLTLLYFAVAYLLILRVRRWLSARRSALASTPEGTLQSYALSLCQLVAPFIGLFAFALALETLDPQGLRSNAVIRALPNGGAMIIVGLWLAGQFFPRAPLQGLIGYEAAPRQKARYTAAWLSWGVGLWLPFIALMDSGGVTAPSQAVLNLPIICVLGLLLYRFGLLIAIPVREDAPEAIFIRGGGFRVIVGRFCRLVAVAAVLLAAVGFAAAAEAIILPTLMSLAVLGVVIFLQRMVTDFYVLWANARGREDETLVPILLSFGLLVLALPIFALQWGVRQSEMLEIWARFREGLIVGETRLSPTDFMTFVIIFTAGYILTRLIQNALSSSILPRTRLDIGAQNAVIAGVGYIGIGLAAIIAITSAGVDLSNLAIVAGALSVGIGFGLQNIVSNFVSGIILLIERPVSEGDWIEVGGQMGYVRDISVRSTRIETFDRTDVIIPNADLVSGQVTNWTRGNLSGRVVVPIGVAYGSDVDRVTEILREIAEAHPMVVMTPPPSVIFSTFGASSLDFEIRAILRDVNFVVKARSEMNYEIARRFAQEGIEIPFPQQDLWLRNPEALPK